MLPFWQPVIICAWKEVAWTKVFLSNGMMCGAVFLVLKKIFFFFNKVETGTHHVAHLSSWAQSFLPPWPPVGMTL